MLFLRRIESRLKARTRVEKAAPHSPQSRTSKQINNRRIRKRKRWTNHRIIEYDCLLELSELGTSAEAAVVFAKALTERHAICPGLRKTEYGYQKTRIGATDFRGGCGRRCFGIDRTACDRPILPEGLNEYSTPGGVNNTTPGGA